MYLKHFGLIELPFRITPDTSFAHCARGHQEALNTLLTALNQGEGFVKICGEVGTGKTLLCRRLLQLLDEGDDAWVKLALRGQDPFFDEDAGALMNFDQYSARVFHGLPAEGMQADSHD